MWVSESAPRCDCWKPPFGLRLMTSQSPAFMPKVKSNKDATHGMCKAGWVGGSPAENIFLHPNTQPVTSLAAEPWELITSKCKCVKSGIQKREEVVHLFINTSAEVGLDAFHPLTGFRLVENHHRQFIRVRLGWSLKADLVLAGCLPARVSFGMIEIRGSAGDQLTF